MKLSVEVGGGFPPDDGITAFWRTNQWHPHGDMDYVKDEYQNRQDDFGLNLIVIRDGHEVIACSIGKIQKLPLNLRFGYRLFKGPSLNTLVVHRSGFIGNWEQASWELLLERWQEFMASGLVDMVSLRGIPLDSPLHRIVACKVPLFRQDYFQTIQEYWLLRQLDSFAGFARSHPQLSKTFRKQRNRLARLFGDKVAIRCYRNLAEMAVMLQDSEEVGKKTWQRKHGAPSFLADDERWKYEFYFSRGWGRAYVLYLDQMPVAFQHGNTYQGVFHAVCTGYDPSYRNLGVGAFLLMNVIKDLCGEADIHMVDFNVGNAEDKKQYCDNCFQVSDINLYGPGRRLWFPAALHLASQGGHELAKGIAHRLGCYRSLRKQLR